MLRWCSEAKTKDKSDELSAVEAYKDKSIDSIGFDLV